jgi:hypothetical protein
MKLEHTDNSLSVTFDIVWDSNYQDGKVIS